MAKPCSVDWIRRCSEGLGTLTALDRNTNTPTQHWPAKRGARHLAYIVCGGGRVDLIETQSGAYLKVATPLPCRAPEPVTTLRRRTAFS